MGVTPNQVTVAGCALGLGAAVAVASGHARIGIGVWLASRVLDGYDGLLAQLTGGQTLFGGYLDITLDMLAYTAMAVAFAFAMPEDWFLWILVVAGYVMAITTTLALSSLVERADRQLGGNRTIQFTPGLAEAGETSIIYVLLVLAPMFSPVILTVWIILLAGTLLQRTSAAYRLLR